MERQMTFDREKFLAIAASVAMTAAILASQAYLAESAAGTWKIGNSTVEQTVDEASNPLPPTRG
jgi:hypothetical protein